MPGSAFHKERQGESISMTDHAKDHYEKRLEDYDDVFDLGLERSITLMHHAASLAHSKTSHINVLSVIEGFKTRDLPELLSCCDKVILLFPPEHIADEMGANDLIELLSKTLGKERISVYYANESL